MEPTDVTYGSDRRVWWRCSVQDCGHGWRAKVCSRTRGSGCPACHRRPASGKSLADRHPEIAAEWDRERNEMALEDVTYGSGRRVWWRCSVPHCGHRWQARVNNRTRGSGCPKCHWRPDPGQSLADKHPELIVEWDDVRNPMTPQDVRPVSQKRVWWRCRVTGCGHRWQIAVVGRARGSGCPKCRWRLAFERSPDDSQDTAQQRDGENAKHRSRKPDITETHPRVAAEWDHERNEMEPTDVTYGSGREVWWRCSVQDCGHGWRAKVCSRTRGSGCPKRHRSPASGKSLADRHPELIIEWDDERNQMTPQDVMYGSKTKIWWRCSVQDCGHRWQATANNRSRGSGCPRCRWRPRPGQSLADKHPELVVEWDDERNPMTPQDVTPGSGRKVWWRCSAQDCGHRWQAVVVNRAKRTGCPRCAGLSRLTRQDTNEARQQDDHRGVMPGRGMVST